MSFNFLFLIPSLFSLRVFLWRRQTHCRKGTTVERDTGDVDERGWHRWIKQLMLLTISCANSAAEESSSIHAEHMRSLFLGQFFILPVFFKSVLLNHCKLRTHIQVIRTVCMILYVYVSFRNFFLFQILHVSQLWTLFFSSTSQLSVKTIQCKLRIGASSGRIFQSFTIQPLFWKETLSARSARSTVLAVHYSILLFNLLKDLQGTSIKNSSFGKVQWLPWNPNMCTMNHYDAGVMFVIFNEAVAHTAQVKGMR